MAQSSIRQRCGQVEGCQLPPGAVPGPGHGAAEHRARQPAAQRVILVAAASLATFSLTRNSAMSNMSMTYFTNDQLATNVKG